MDPSRLVPLSSKKLWKMKHGYKLKKVNKHLEKKGVF
jgi:ATP-dependent RNA helicase DDX56/DBP9